MEHSCIVLYDFQGFREIKVVKLDFLSTTGNYISFRSPTLSLLVSVELTCLTESQVQVSAFCCIPCYLFSD